MCTVDKTNQVVQGIASRIQRGTCWRTFTVRAITDNGSFDTEYKKRSKAIRNGDMYPTWTIQAYIGPDDLAPSKILCTVGIIRTTELFAYINNELATRHFETWGDFEEALRYDSSIGELAVRQNYSGGAVFLSCSWDKMIAKGIDMKILYGVFDD